MNETPGTPDRPEWLSVAEMAKEVRVAKMTIYRLVRSGEIPSSLIGKTVRVRRADWIDYLERDNG